MFGRMQDWPLLMHKIIDFAAIQFPRQEVASRTIEGPMHRTNYRELRERALKVAKRLERDGIRLGDRVATLAWNGYRHLETLVRNRRRRRGLSHGQSATFPRADRVDHQPRRGSDRADRPHLRAAVGGDGRSSAERRAVHRSHRRGPYACRRNSRTPFPTKTGSPRSTATSRGRSSTNAPRPASATPRAPPAIRRACFIPIVRTSCIR